MSLAFTTTELRRLQSVQRLLLDPPEDDAALPAWVESVCAAIRRLLGTDHVYYLEPKGLLLPSSPLAPGADEWTGDGASQAGDGHPQLFVQAASGGEAFEAGIQRHFLGFEDGFSQFREAYPTLQHRMIRAAGPCAVHDAPLHDMALRERLMIYQDVFRPPGIDRQMAVSVPLPDGEAMLIAGYDRQEAPAFDGKRHQMLTFLTAAFESGIRFRQHRVAAQQRLYSALDAGSMPLIAFGPNAQEMHRNPAFRQLAHAPGTTEATEHVLVGAARRLARGLVAPGRPSPVLSTQDVVDTPSGTYRLRVRPLSASDGRTGAVVSVERTSLLPPPGAIRKRFDLTPREAEVALLLAEGLTDAEIAEGLFISVHTARRHSGQVLKKLDVSSRAAVAMTLLRG